MTGWQGCAAGRATGFRRAYRNRSRSRNVLRTDAFLQQLRESGRADAGVLPPVRRRSAGRTWGARAATASSPRSALGHLAAHRFDPLLCARNGLDRRDHRAGVAALPPGRDGPVPRFPGAVPVCGVADERPSAEVGSGAALALPLACPGERGPARDVDLHDGEGIARRSILAAPIRGTGASFDFGES